MNGCAADCLYRLLVKFAFTRKDTGVFFPHAHKFLIRMVRALDINQLIINIMVVFMILAALDKCFGSRFGLGGQLSEALDTIGPMCIPMVGMILLAPLLGQLLWPVITPVFRLLGADPAMFACCILACDMGGHSLASAMAATPEAAQFSGCILGTSLGGAVSFIIPVGISMIRRDYRACFAIGVLAGVVTVPVGLFTGGLLAGYDISMVFHNTLPVLLFSLFIALALWKAQRAAIRVFELFGAVISAVAVIGFTVGVIQELTPVVILPGLPSVLDGIKIVGSVAIVLCGAYPLLHLVGIAARGPIEKLGRFLGIDQNAVTGILGGFANIMPILNGCNRMSPAGVVVALAFAVSGSCAFGDHLGFVASVDRSMIFPMIISKLAGSFSAVLVAMLLCRKNHFSQICEAETAQAAEQGGGL